MADPIENGSKPELVQVFKIHPISPSPENDQVYNPSDVSALAKDIAQRGLLEPLVINGVCSLPT